MQAFCVHAQSYLTKNCRGPPPSPGSSVHGIFQAGILEPVAISYARGSSWPRDGLCLLHLQHWQVNSLPLHHTEVFSVSISCGRIISHLDAFKRLFSADCFDSLFFFYFPNIALMACTFFLLNVKSLI